MDPTTERSEYDDSQKNNIASARLKQVENDKISPIADVTNNIDYWTEQLTNEVFKLRDKLGPISLSAPVSEPTLADRKQNGSSEVYYRLEKHAQHLETVTHVVKEMREYLEI
jgi:hypothetical protein